MTTALRQRYAPGLHWWVRRNPTYLFSAVCMALGARMLLVSPETSPAGDVALIVLTLAALQLYEWAVTACLLGLHRSGRSPEDQPSLLLVAALFWTGPLAATMEMSAQRADLGIILSVGACAVALVEMHAVRRLMGWRFTPWGQCLAGACVVLVAAAQPLLKIPDGRFGTNELLLYALWWCVAGLALLALPAIRSHARGTGLGRDARLEGGLMLAAIAAAVAHLAAMNHAFVGHTRLFYVTPLLMALAVGFMEWGAQSRSRISWAGALGPWLPGAAVWLAFDRFDAEVLTDALPVILRDPLLTTLLLALLVYLYGFIRLGWYALLHAGVLAAVWAGYRALPLVWPVGVENVAVASGAGTARIAGLHWGLACYALAAYLVVFAWRQRSRMLGGLALVAQQAGWVLLLWGRGEVADMVIAFTCGWTLLALVHVVFRHPAAALRALPLMVLLIAGWLMERDADLFWWVKLHALVLVMILLAVGQWQRWTCYRSAGMVIAVLSNVPWWADWTLHAAHGKAVMTVVSGFALLALGATISWHKRVLLDAALGTEAGESNRAVTEEPAERR